MAAGTGCHDGGDVNYDHAFVVRTNRCGSSSVFQGDDRATKVQNKTAATVSDCNRFQNEITFTVTTGFGNGRKMVN